MLNINRKVIVYVFISMFVLASIKIVKTNWDANDDSNAKGPNDSDPFEHPRFRRSPSRDENLDQRSPESNISLNKVKPGTLEQKVSLLTSRFSVVSAALERLWCQTQEVMSNGGFCVTSENIFTGGNVYFDLEICYFMEEFVGNASIVDLGAGIGFYGMCFLRLHQSPFKASKDQVQQHTDVFLNKMARDGDSKQVVHSWHGYDGAFGIDEVSGGFIRNVDLGEEGLWLGRRWDWVMSVEVGEHIGPEKEDFFLDNLVRHACKGVLLTWAVMGQPGHYHVNNHNNDYIKNKMADRGFRNDIDAEQQLRHRITNTFLKATAMIFTKVKEESCLNY